MRGGSETGIFDITNDFLLKQWCIGLRNLSGEHPPGNCLGFGCEYHHYPQVEMLGCQKGGRGSLPIRPDQLLRLVQRIPDSLGLFLNRVFQGCWWWLLLLMSYCITKGGKS